ncbi:hypothetical protein DFH07DRAFT_43937 [Mycena maculata]|uniref:Uncharacterized protein n=1 Tax=Mycena maculata TaxID=230809 RepID=A0AAD7II25_9AGAR|nr:hypothetical protein DFH07DRAFT_43937 [Mycena maculata]
MIHDAPSRAKEAEREDEEGSAEVPGNLSLIHLCPSLLPQGRPARNDARISSPPTRRTTAHRHEPRACIFGGISSRIPASAQERRTQSALAWVLCTPRRGRTPTSRRPAGGSRALEHSSARSSCGIYWRSWRDGTRALSANNSLFGHRGARWTPGRPRRVGRPARCRGRRFACIPLSCSRRPDPASLGPHRPPHFLSNPSLRSWISPGVLFPWGNDTATSLGLGLPHGNGAARIEDQHESGIASQSIHKTPRDAHTGHHPAPLVDPRALERRLALGHLLAELAQGNGEFECERSPLQPWARCVRDPDGVRGLHAAEEWRPSSRHTLCHALAAPGIRVLPH